MPSGCGDRSLPVVLRLPAGGTNGGCLRAREARDTDLYLWREIKNAKPYSFISSSTVPSSSRRRELSQPLWVLIFHDDETTPFLSWAAGTHLICLPVQCRRVDGARTYPSLTRQGLRVLFASLLALTGGEELATPASCRGLGAIRQLGRGSSLHKGAGTFLDSSLSSAPTKHKMLTPRASTEVEMEAAMVERPVDLNRTSSLPFLCCPPENQLSPC